jgi:hypothetical protein
MITITTRAAASSTNTMTFPERRLWNRVHVRAITRKKEGLILSINRALMEEDERIKKILINSETGKNKTLIEHHGEALKIVQAQ